MNQEFNRKITQELLTSLHEISDYMHQAEYENWRENGSPENHIFKDVRELDDFIRTLEDTFLSEYIVNGSKEYADMIRDDIRKKGGILFDWQDGVCDSIDVFFRATQEVYEEIKEYFENEGMSVDLVR